MTLVLFFKPTPSWVFFFKKKLPHFGPPCVFILTPTVILFQKKLVGIGVGHIRDRGLFEHPRAGVSEANPRVLF